MVRKCSLEAEEILFKRDGQPGASELVSDNAMKDAFSTAELKALRDDLRQGVQIDSRDAAELVQLFLMGRDYGTSPEVALDAVARVEMSGCSMPVLQSELERLALVM